jgi:hypothetical protein
MALDQIFDGLDLTGLHLVLAIYGAIITVYVMQLTSHEHEDRDDPPVVRVMRRLGLAGMALGFLWSALYSDGRQWQPWPPVLLVFLAFDVVMTVKAAAIWHRIGRTGHWREPSRNPVNDLIRRNGIR